MTTWNVVQSYLVTNPPSFTTTTDDELKQALQDFADAKKRGPAIGNLEFEFYTDQVDAFFKRNGKTIRFMTLHAAA